MLKSTQWGTGMDECLDEMQYDSTSVDDWGVNRDMQKAYRFIPLFLVLPWSTHPTAPICPETPMAIV